MHLKEYRWKHSTSYVEIARKLKKSRNHVNLIANKKIIPSKSLALLIEMITDGEVTAKELLNEQEESVK
jgi:ribosome-binding protein aMBF1 (putative translation factor)